jgi:peptide/nickel transport system permease protein
VTRYLGVRLGQAVAIILVVSFGSFLLLHLAPGDPARIALGNRVTPQSLVYERQRLGLDHTLIGQYWNFVSGLFRGHFGQAMSVQQSVGSLLGPSLLVSLLLILYALVLALLISLPLGVLAAVRSGRISDHIVRVIAMVAFAAPPFVVAILLILGFSLKLRIFPPSGYGQGFANHLGSLTLPAIVLALYVSPILLRSLRSSLVQTLESDFVETARARGFSELRVLYRHVLRNSLMPTVTLLGITAGFLLSYTVVVENIFSIPGLGSLLVTSVEHRDYHVLQALTVVFAGLVVSANLIADLTYRRIDPRVRL